MKSLKSHLRPTNSYQDPRWFIGASKCENHWLEKLMFLILSAFLSKVRNCIKVRESWKVKRKSPIFIHKGETPGWQLAYLEKELAQVPCCKPHSEQIDTTAYKTTTQRSKLTALVKISKNSNIHMRNGKLKTTLLECSVLPPQGVDISWHIIEH